MSHRSCTSQATQLLESHEFIFTLQSDRTSWQLRAAFADATMAAAKLDCQDVMKNEWALPTLIEVLSDTSYEARCAAAGLLNDALHPAITSTMPGDQVVHCTYFRLCIMLSTQAIELPVTELCKTHEFLS